MNFSFFFWPPHIRAQTVQVSVKKEWSRITRLKSHLIWFYIRLGFLSRNIRFESNTKSKEQNTIQFDSPVRVLGGNVRLMVLYYVGVEFEGWWWLLWATVFSALCQADIQALLRYFLMPQPEDFSGGTWWWWWWWWWWSSGAAHSMSSSARTRFRRALHSSIQLPAGRRSAETIL